jgi:YbbR domain-containing protein
MLRRFLKNWPYKLLALGTAIILTTYVHGELNPWTTASVDVPLRTMHLPDGFCIAKQSLTEVSVTLSGPKADVDSAAQSDQVRAWVDLKRVRAGERRLPINVSVPATLARSVSGMPATPTVALSIESKLSRILPIHIKPRNSWPIGYAIGEQVIDPASATISGGASAVNKVSRLVVVADPTPLRPSVDETLPIKALDSQGNEVTDIDFETTRAHVVMRLMEALDTRVVTINAITTGQPAFSYKVASIDVAPNSLAIKGKPERLVGTSVIYTDEVDVSEATSDVTRYVRVHVPAGIQIDGSDTVKVTVRIVQVAGSRE